jgi:hypothetical protein
VLGGSFNGALGGVSITVAAGRRRAVVGTIGRGPDPLPNGPCRLQKKGDLLVPTHMGVIVRRLGWKRSSTHDHSNHGNRGPYENGSKLYDEASNRVALSLWGTIGAMAEMLLSRRCPRVRAAVPTPGRTTAIAYASPSAARQPMLAFDLTIRFESLSPTCIRRRYQPFTRIPVQHWSGLGRAKLKGLERSQSRRHWVSSISVPACAAAKANESGAVDVGEDLN